MKDKRFIVFGKIGEDTYEQCSIPLTKEKAFNFARNHSKSKVFSGDYSVMVVYEFHEKFIVE
tara:strand:+ start:344 stop:529 length:186 start_codon:yes stop_codon:yes gene_type:complete